MDNVEQVHSGDTIIINDGETLYLACCDCSLVHRMAVSVKGKQVSLTVKRDNYRTKRERLKHKITMKVCE